MDGFYFLYRSNQNSFRTSTHTFQKSQSFSLKFFGDDRTVFHLPKLIKPTFEPLHPSRQLWGLLGSLRNKKKVSFFNLKLLFHFWPPMPLNRHKVLRQWKHLTLMWETQALVMSHDLILWYDLTVRVKVSMTEKLKKMKQPNMFHFVKNKVGYILILDIKICEHGTFLSFHVFH